MSQPALKRHPYEDAQRAELARWPGVVASHEIRGKHFALVLRFGEVSRFVIYPSTPGDSGRGALNHVREIRHTLAGLGATRIETVKATAPRRRRQRMEIPTPRLQSVSDTRLCQDPFSQLAQLRFEAPKPQPIPPQAPEPMATKSHFNPWPLVILVAAALAWAFAIWMGRFLADMVMG